MPLEKVPQEHVYEVMGSETSHLGVYTSLAKAKEAALKVNDSEVQINRIPLDQMSYFGEYFDCVWSKQEMKSLHVLEFWAFA